jgi:hypothetical protein
MLQHLFYVMIGLISKFKGIQKPFEFEFGKSNWEKEKGDPIFNAPYMCRHG